MSDVKEQRIREALDTIVEKGGTDRDGYRGHELTLVTLVESALTKIQRLEGVLREVMPHAPHRVRSWSVPGDGGMERHEECVPSCPRCTAVRALSGTEGGA